MVYVYNGEALHIAEMTEMSPARSHKMTVGVGRPWLRLPANRTHIPGLNSYRNDFIDSVENFS